MAAAETIPFLLSLPSAADLKDRRALSGDDLVFWQQAARLVLQLLAEEHFLPGLCKGNQTLAAWEPYLEGPNVYDKIQRLAQSMPPLALAFPKESNTSHAPSAVVMDFVRTCLDTEIRKAVAGSANIPHARTRQEAWLNALAAPIGRLAVLLDESPELDSAFAQSVATWRRRLSVSCGDGWRVGLQLAEPGEGETAWKLGYYLQSTAEASLLVPAKDLWEQPAKRFMRAAAREKAEERLLAGLALAGQLFPQIETSLQGSSRPAHCPLNVTEAHRFLKETAPLLLESGFALRLPPWWKSAQAPKLSVRVTLSPKENGSSGFGMDAIFSFNWRVALGEATLDAQQFQALVASKVPLVQLRGQWVEVDAELLKKAVDFWQDGGEKGMTLAEAMQRVRSDPASDGALELGSVEAEGWLKDVFAGTSKEARLKTLPAPGGFSGQLRPYQVRGFSWLSFLKGYGFGTCLADDVGLGKTIQLLAFLLHEKDQKALEAPVLLLCPTSVVANWEKEARRFAPSLRVCVHHGSNRYRSASYFADEAKKHDLVISTYTLARLDHALLSRVEWSGLALDEAQNIKNPLAKQSRMIRSIKGNFRIALTGTPVENRLSELWSIMEFLNPGYLGSYETFSKGLAYRVEVVQDEKAARLLRQLIQPFILRRMKTDPAIVSDLPEKLEMKVFCSLTREQATLYQATVADMLKQIEEAEGMNRRGLILAALTKLKQACNHPAHLLKDGSALAGRSGKLERLAEMLEEVLEEKESALLFTQYTEMGDILKKYLQNRFLEEVLFFHGGLSKKAREEMIGRFQEGKSRILILTLKAGGVGLNLTRANHVFHFDRWWNPAVENQATDLAFRIGQTKKVMVHKLICAGTLEEKIDALIEPKKRLAANVLGAGEGWLTELSNAELRDLLTLRSAALEATPA